MRSQGQSSDSPFGYVDLESRAPAKHRARLIREMLGVTPNDAQSAYDTGRARQEAALDGRAARHLGYAALAESCGPFDRRRGTTV
jgi:hypothetical protein